MAHPQSSSLRVFVSYRHDDVPAYSGRLADRLVSRFGEDGVFLDIDAIDPGLDFRVVLRQAIEACDIVLVVIGPGWLEAREPDGSRRLEQPNDYVRLEIEAALDREIRIIPVLVDGAHMPTADQLPEELVPLCYRNAVEMGKNFHTEMSALITKLERIEQAKPKEPSAPTPVVEAGEAATASPRRPEAATGTRASTTQVPVLETGEERSAIRWWMRVRRRTLGAVAPALVVAAGGLAVIFALTGGDNSDQKSHAESIAGLVPFFDEWNCRTTRPSSASVAEQAACSPVEGAEKAQLLLFKSKHAQEAAYMQRVKRADVLSPSHIKPNSGKCTKSDWGGEIEWTHAENVAAGRELCYITSGGSDLAWTYMDASLLITGHRSDQAHENLYQWFEDHAHKIDPGAAAGGEHAGEHM
jgi:TIR domain